MSFSLFFIISYLIFNEKFNFNQKIQIKNYLLLSVEELDFELLLFLSFLDLLLDLFNYL